MSWFLWGISNACIAQETDKDNITLSVKDESVEKVLKRLGKETDFNFFYDPSVLNTVSLVTLDVRGASLQNVLDLISAQTGLSFKRTDKTISVSKGKEIKNSRSKNGNITYSTGSCWRTGDWSQYSDKRYNIGNYY